MEEDKIITKINSLSTALINSKGIDGSKVSEAHRMFIELYNHRVGLYIALCRIIALSEMRDSYYVWKSILVDGWFIMGVVLPDGKQISYHLPSSAYDKTEFAEVRATPVAFDGHTSSDVLVRLQEIIPLS